MSPLNPVISGDQRGGSSDRCRRTWKSILSKVSVPQKIWNIISQDQSRVQWCGRQERYVFIVFFYSNAFVGNVFNCNRNALINKYLYIIHFKKLYLLLQAPFICLYLEARQLLAQVGALYGGMQPVIFTIILRISVVVSRK